MLKIAMKYCRRVLFLTVAIVVAIWWIGIDGFLVASRAESAAGDRPYCIETVEPKNASFYLRVERIEDLSWRHMFNSRGLTEMSGQIGEHHAIMKLVDSPWYLNWSYRASAFVAEVANREYLINKPNDYHAPQLDCTPVAHFVKTLKWY
ncbi:hypothetical protein [Rhizobium sp. ZPR3]|uniref:Uncharacterized protein n=2 Tax=unclassified Rhizobium TaxID=2613769 RepID=A0AAU7SQZ7_9HYPH